MLYAKCHFIVTTWKKNYAATVFVHSFGTHSKLPRIFCGTMLSYNFQYYIIHRMYKGMPAKQNATHTHTHTCVFMRFYRMWNIFNTKFVLVVVRACVFFCFFLFCKISYSSTKKWYWKNRFHNISQYATVYRVICWALLH